MTEWQLVDNTLHKRLGTIEVVAGVIAPLIDIEGQAAIVAGLKAHAFAEGVRGGGREAVREVPVKFQLQSMVAGRVSGKQEIGVRLTPKRGVLGLPGVREAHHRGGIKVVIYYGIHAVITDIS